MTLSGESPFSYHSELDHRPTRDQLVAKDTGCHHHLRLLEIHLSVMPGWCTIQPKKALLVGKRADKGNAASRSLESPPVSCGVGRPSFHSP